MITKKRTFSTKEPTSVIAVLQEIISTCDACRIRESTAMSLFKKCSTGLAEAAVETQVALTNSANFHYQGAMKSYSSIV